MGNINAKLKYEQWVPPSYRRVDSITPQVMVVVVVVIVVVVIVVIVLLLKIYSTKTVQRIEPKAYMKLIEGSLQKISLHVFFML